jgi:hypothetical protein
MREWFRKLDETVKFMLMINTLLSVIGGIVFIGGPLISGKFDVWLTSEAIFLFVGIFVCTYMVNRYSKTASVVPKETRKE